MLMLITEESAIYNAAAPISKLYHQSTAPFRGSKLRKQPCTARPGGCSLVLVSSAPSKGEGKRAEAQRRTGGRRWRRHHSSRATPSLRGDPSRRRAPGFSLIPWPFFLVSGGQPCFFFIELIHCPLLECAMAAGATLNWVKTPFDARRFHDLSSLSFRCRSPFGSIQPCWLPIDQDSSLIKVRVAADYSDSVPDSKYTRDRGYHPLEEVKERPKKKDLLLTDVETAKTVVEANSKGLLVFPARVHNEPHGHVAWSEFQYAVDDYGDIFFEVPDSENILEDDTANNPVTVLIGMDGPIIGENSVVVSDFNDYMDGENFMDVPDEHYTKIDTEITDILIEWGMPETMRTIHPIYFSKCLRKAVHDNHEEKMDIPSNGVSIVGYLRPAFIEEESYLRSLFHGECNSDGYSSDWKANGTDGHSRETEPVSGTNRLIDDEKSRFDFNDAGTSTDSMFYKLEIMTVELFSMYGKQLMIDPQDFQDSEPDILASSASAIIERIKENSDQCAMALRSLCRRKKGLSVQEASLIGVDSLGIDVRAFSGLEARTVRFSFNAQALSERSAEKKIRRMLFPRSQRKSVKTSTEDES